MYVAFLAIKHAAQPVDAARHFRPLLQRGEDCPHSVMVVAERAEEKIKKPGSVHHVFVRVHSCGGYCK